ncbi:MAG TPA: cytochrome c oxidase subunit II [Bacteroidia bacterium]|nr:cytochrome c oxidase subunit II [Bacteroidia bacterium]
MNFIIYVILILAAAALWQLIRVVELSAKLKGVDPNKVTERDNRMNGRFWLIFMICMWVFSIWQLLAYKDLLLPEAASEHGKEIDWLWDFNMLIVWIIFLLTNTVLFVMAWKYYGRDGQRATYYPHNNKLEMLWTGVPAVVLFVIIFLGIRLWNTTLAPADKSVRIVELYAKQFSWSARYSGVDNKLGTANYKLIFDANVLGIDSTDGTAADDVIITDTLYLPVGEEVNFRFRAQDVLHSAYFPHFRAQMNCVPGMETFFHFKPTKTTEQMREITGNPEFDYVLLCNKICGTSHYNMQLKIVVGTPKQYDEFITRHVTFSGEKAKTEYKTPFADAGK